MLMKWICCCLQGFCRYLEKNFSDLKKRGVVIGFDARAHLSSGGSSKRYFLGIKYFADVLHDLLWPYNHLDNIFSFSGMN